MYPVTAFVREIERIAATKLRYQTGGTGKGGVCDCIGLIKAGTRINWHGTLKQAAVDLWNTAESNPDNAPTLWQDIAYRDGIRIIPQTITVTEAFAKGEKGWWGDSLYESLIDVNVYTPEQYPAGWQTVD